MSAEALQVAKVYRHLLRAVKKHVAKEDRARHFKEYVTEEFRNNCKLSDPSSIQQKIKLAHNYTFLLNSVHHHQDLLFSYNIAVDRSDEMKKVLGKSAASVGLQLSERKENQQLIWIGQPHSIPRQSRSSLTADTTDTCTTFYRLIHHWSSRKKLMGTTNWHWQLLREEPDHNADG
ncbi:unnamed protein product [Prunus armeniaca]